MANQKMTAAQAWAKFAVNRPHAAMAELKSLDAEERQETIEGLRVYPVALTSLLREAPRGTTLKGEIEVQLEAAGFKMMT